MTDIFPPSGRRVPKWPAYARACACASACVLALAVAPVASAEVIEISANGEVARFSGPVTITNAGAAPIVAPAPRVATPFVHAGQSVELSPALIEAVAWVESRINQSARSPAGAIGVMQLMPDTAAALGVDPANTAENLRGGAVYLRQMLDEFDGDVVLALAAYNAGPGAVRRYGGVPPYPETQAYVANVLAHLARAAGEETQQ